MQFANHCQNIESSFRQLRLFGIVYLCVCTLLVGYSVWKATVLPRRNDRRYMCLTRVKSLMLALAQDLQHEPALGGTGACVADFHELFFLALAPTRAPSRANTQRALFRYATARPTGDATRPCRAGVLQPCHIRRITQRIEIDCVKCDFRSGLRCGGLFTSPIIP